MFPYPFAVGNAGWALDIDEKMHANKKKLSQSANFPTYVRFLRPELGEITDTTKLY